MTAMASRKKPCTLVVQEPEKSPGELKRIGGSRSDDWNNILILQAVDALWVNNSSEEQQEKQFKAAVAGLMGIGPRDEMEGMIAAQLVAAHSATMECFRRAMIGEQTFEGRRENLNQANRLSRTYAALLEALNRHRGKGQQKVTVENVNVHQGGQAIVGTVEQQGGGPAPKSEEQPHALTDAPGTAMPGTLEAEREPVSRASSQG